jgi:hypothetical protein
MIQRKQTIWLFIASLIILLTLFIPYGIHIESPSASNAITETDLNAKTTVIMLVLTIASALFSFFTIFLFNNRKLQMKLCWVAVLLDLSVLGYQWFNASQTDMGNKLVVGILGSKIYLGVLVPILSVFFIMLGYTGIKKDEKLIRDSDRLR